MDVNYMDGIAYGKVFTSYGGTRGTQSENKLKEDIKFLLMQEKGRFYADPEFGSLLHSFLYEPMTEATANMIKEEVYNCIGQFYPQILLRSVDVDMNTVEKSIAIKVIYSYDDSEDVDSIDLTLFNEIK